MAYGTEAGVLYFLTLAAVDTDYFTSAHITIAITHADNWVDQLNTNADATSKTQASDMLAAGELIYNYSLDKNKFNASNSQTNGQSATVPLSNNPNFKQAKALLLRQATRFYRTYDTTETKTTYYYDNTL